MKRIKLFSNIALMGLLVLGAASCSDWLTLSPQDRIVEEDFWEDKNDLEGVRYAAYKQMAANINKFVIWGDIRSDSYALASYDAAQGSRNTYQNIRAAMLDSTMSEYDWGAIYTTINYCNKVLQHGSEVLERDPQFTSTEWKEMKAEITALRALNYFYLLRAFKDIPYSTQVINSDEEVMDFPTVNQLDVLDTLIHEVRPLAGQARNRFEYSYDTQGMMTNTAIYALLADMYLWRSALREGRGFDRNLVIQDCDSVIEFGQKSLDKLADVNNMNSSLMGSSSGRIRRDDFGSGLPNASLISNEEMRQDFTGKGDPTVDSYRYLFHRSGQNSSTETMFAIQYNQDDLKSNWIYNFYGNENQTHFIVSDAVLNIYGTDKATEAPNDARYWYSCNTMHSKSDREIPREAEDRVCLKWNDCQFFYRDVTQADKIWVYEQTSDYHNWIIYRQTDVMLMMAEAMIAKADASANENDANLAAAKKIIDAVHKRSNVDKTKVLTAGSKNRNGYMKLLMDERQIEFLGEGRRWFDLVRYAERYAMDQIQTSVSDDGTTEYEKTKASSDIVISPDPREPQYVDGTMGVRKIIADFLGVADSKMASVYKTRIKNRYGLYCPIYYRELSANHGQLQQNPVWNREK